MADHIAFLHTADVHVASFSALMQVQAPQLRVRHVVDTSLLADAQRLGSDDAGLRDRVHQAMRAAAGGGARQVVCTCSTIGGIAEAMPTGRRFEAARIDRAMADRAALLGPRVLMVVALASTVQATRALLLDSAARLQRSIRIELLLVEPAWAHFQRGDRSAYLSAIAQATRDRVGKADVVVLGQASMAAAAELLNELDIEVLSSPALGVARAVERWASLASTCKESSA